ncbi:MAG: glycosyltransferase family 4 protein, partial [Candidatus Binatia bacterium]
LKARAEVGRRLRDAIRSSSIVHMGDGAHPIPLDQIAWPLAGQMGKTRIWVFDGSDAIPRLRAHAQSRSNVFKRQAWALLVRHREAFTRRAVRESDLVFAHNAAVVERFADVWNERCHFFDRTFVTQETLVTDEVWHTRATALADVRRPLRLVVAGRQIGIKGTDHILRAMALAVREGAALELDVIGDGEDLASFESLSVELGLQDRVHFRGSVPYGTPLFRRMSEAQVMVLANLTPEISRNVLLSMALGLSIVAYRNPGTDALIESNDAGLLVESGNVEALARALVASARDREALVRLASNGRRVAAKNTLEACHRQRADLAMRCALQKIGSTTRPNEVARSAPLES